MLVWQANAKIHETLACPLMALVSGTENGFQVHPFIPFSAFAVVVRAVKMPELGRRGHFHSNPKSLIILVSCWRIWSFDADGLFLKNCCHAPFQFSTPLPVCSPPGFNR